MTQQAEDRGYKKTLNLPKTPFAMKGNLVQNEPVSQKRWDKADLYALTRGARPGAEPFYFHDGPPYANGSIHLGHLLNKVLKDFVVRTRTMAGRDVPYVPGWDCHGLPIEHKVMLDLGDKARDMDAMAIRRKCRSSAEKFIKLQKKQMQRLLTLADYDDPYLTMTPAYEAAVLEVFADLVAAGVVYRGLKPVHWSIENRTALADAELEYDDREDTSVFVRFDLADREESLMIWTTTPWTLPANLAVAVHPGYEYGEYAVEGRRIILATDLAPRVLGEGVAPARTVPGAAVVGLEYRHPFIDRIGRVVAAEYVTLEDGTGLVHTAPGHGVDDYQTGLREGLEIYCPVRDDGTFDDTAPDWLRGRSVWDANGLVVDRLRGSGHLFREEKFTHSYPHDWRGKTPVIFRATEQWFVNVNKAFGGGECLRDRALASTADVRFFPEWGRNRMRGMLEKRPDWCLSRQRAWGLPIPAFYPPEGVEGAPLLTAASVRAVARVVAELGSDAWFGLSPEQLLEHYDPGQDPDAPDWAGSRAALHATAPRTSRDIFDVWFESGSSWHAVMRKRFGDTAVPTDLYLEGSDQHRGWFQLSLLPALGTTGEPPFRTVLTHGFMVDKDGRKMSKSLGNTLEVDELLKSYGADVCRWWVGSLSTDNDVKVDESFFKVAGEEYRKVRNTIRFLLSNLSDFDEKNHAHRWTDADATGIDAWAMDAYVRMAGDVKACYENYRFREASRLIFGFCNDTMSAVYLAAVKDRLYCDPPDSPRRRRTQSAIRRITSGLIRLLAPILPHTADEAWRALHPGDGDACVHLDTFPSLSGCAKIPCDPRWEALGGARENWQRALERFRQEHDVDNPLDLGLTAGGDLAGFDPVDLADLCGISRFTVAADAGAETRVEDLRDQPRCERSWKRDGTVKQRSDDGWLSDRDAQAMGLV